MHAPQAVLHLLMGRGKGGVPVLPSKCPPHIWTPIYNDEREIIGRICTKCGKQEGK